MKTLKQLSKIYGADQDSGKRKYINIYAEYFEPYRNQKIKLFEMGVAHGISLQMWLNFFQNSLIVGMDCFYKEKEKKYVLNLFKGSNRCKVLVGSQSNKEDLSKASLYGNFDFIIDDASHIAEDHQTSMGFLFPYLNSGGYYIIEDLRAKRTHHTTLTTKIIKDYMSTSKFNSKVISNQEKQYIEDNIEFCKFHCDDHICFIKKK